LQSGARHGFGIGNTGSGLMTKKKDETETASEWSTSAKVGAAVGSAALVAALLYAGRRSLTRKKGKLEPLSPEPESDLQGDLNPKADTD
jgi:hypothetical protein